MELLFKIVEVAPSEDLYTSQEHPYTRALLSSIPVPDPRIESKRRLVELSGEIPSPLNPPSGCRFHTRCPIAQVPGVCADVEPPLELKGAGHLAACHFSEHVRTKIAITV